MKRVLALPLLLLIATFSFADHQSEQTQVSFSGARVQEQNYSFDGQLLYPLFGGDRFVIGPKGRYGPDAGDRAAGLSAEFDLFGTHKTSVYLGGNALYHGEDCGCNPQSKYSVEGLGGLKLHFGKHFFVNAFASKAISGKRQDRGITPNVGFGFHFGEKRRP